MMLSTAQALKEWNSIPKLLAVVKTYAAAHPDQPTLPGELESQLGKSADALLKPLSSPHATWKQLLKNKVSKMTRMAPSIAGHPALMPMPHGGIIVLRPWYPKPPSPKHCLGGGPQNMLRKISVELGHFTRQ